MKIKPVIKSYPTVLTAGFFLIQVEKYKVGPFFVRYRKERVERRYKVLNIKVSHFVFRYYYLN
jgi:hypothetical protein